ncbi:hypothetical protein GOODEAATRI_033104, partial [Goodea atripinnis]
QRIADPWRSVFLPVRRNSSSILLLREPTFARWIEGSGVRSSSIPYSAAAPLARSSMIGSTKDGVKIPREDSPMLRSSSLLNETKLLCLEKHINTQNTQTKRERSSEAPIIGAILVNVWSTNKC